MNSKELYDVMEVFEKTHKHMRLNREKRGSAPVGNWYECGHTNTAFKNYLDGYALGKAMWQGETVDKKGGA